jgi:hypothetical protein
MFMASEFAAADMVISFPEHSLKGEAVECNRSESEADKMRGIPGGVRSVTVL